MKLNDHLIDALAKGFLIRVSQIRMNEYGQYLINLLWRELKREMIKAECTHQDLNALAALVLFGDRTQVSELKKENWK